MNDRPNAVELLRIANQALIEEILPDAKSEHTYALRMIANAIGIATREMEYGADHARSEARSIAALYNEDMTLDRQTENNRRLARDIRSGAFEASAEKLAALLAHLRTTARDKLFIVNPRLLSNKK